MVQPRLGDILLGSYKPRVIKGKGLPVTCHEELRDLLLTALLDGGAWSTPRPGHFIPGKEPRYTLKGGWVGPSTGLDSVENRKSLAPTKVRTPNGPAHKELPTALSLTHQDLLGGLILVSTDTTLLFYIKLLKNADQFFSVATRYVRLHLTCKHYEY